MPVRRRETLRLPLLAGWLFADLMLLLFVVGLSFAPAQSKATAKPRPTPTFSPHPVPQERVLQQKYYKINVNVPVPELNSNRSSTPAARKLISGTNAKLAALVARHPELKGKAVGVAVIFGAGPQADINTAISDASHAAKILHAGDPAFRQASFLPEWTGNSTPSYVELIMFFYVS